MTRPVAIIRGLVTLYCTLAMMMVVRAWVTSVGSGTGVLGSGGRCCRSRRMRHPSLMAYGGVGNAHRRRPLLIHKARQGHVPFALYTEGAGGQESSRAG